MVREAIPDPASNPSAAMPDSASPRTCSRPLPTPRAPRPASRSCRCPRSPPPAKGPAPAVTCRNACRCSSPNTRPSRSAACCARHAAASSTRCLPRPASVSAACSIRCSVSSISRVVNRSRPRPSSPSRTSSGAASTFAMTAENCSAPSVCRSTNRANSCRVNVLCWCVSAFSAIAGSSSSCPRSAVQSPGARPLVQRLLRGSGRVTLRVRSCAAAPAECPGRQDCDGRCGCRAPVPPAARSPAPPSAPASPAAISGRSRPPPSCRSRPRAPPFPPARLSLPPWHDLAHGQHDVRVRLQLAIRRPAPMHVQVRHHAARDELLAHKILRQPDRLRLGQLTRQGNLDVARKLRVLTLFARLHLVP